MTVIALINPENDPHIIADCLLSADGVDHRPSKNVWLPSLGLIQTDWEDLKGPWHVVRMGRKTIILPNNGGILSFAGDCGAAFEFWANLSDAINNTLNYNASARIDSGLIDRTLKNMGPAAHQFHMLGVLIDEHGDRRPCIHNAEKMIETKNFGTCYFAGTGTQILSKHIDIEDQKFTKIAKWAWPKISPTEELAESLCSSMLYYESCINNGRSPNTPTYDRFGGFYEWYGIKPVGIRPVPPRIDLNLLVENEKIYITRLHFFETYQPREPENSLFKGPQALLSVLTFCIGKIEISPLSLFANNYSITVDNVTGVIIERIFNQYDRSPETTLSDPRISGLVSADALSQNFGDLFEVRRLRLIVTLNGFAVAKGLTRKENATALAGIIHKNGKTTITLDQDVALTIGDIISKHG